MKLSNNHLKYLKSLHLRKFRQKYHKFIVEGTKIAQEVLAATPHDVDSIFALPEWAEVNAALIVAHEDKMSIISPEELDKISLLTTPNQVLMVLNEPVVHFDPVAISCGLSLYLEDIRDPGNFGSILRIADWFGIPWVFCSPESVEVFNPKVVQASMGAFLRVKCLAIDFEKLCNELHEIPVFGAVLDGAPVFKADITDQAIIVVGNESHGISQHLQTLLDHRISIPKGPNGGAESLNAAVATGIICAAFRNMEG